jgi:hypothetical protein
MRKLSFLFLFAALSLFTTTTFAQEINEDVKNAAAEAVQEKVEIKISELPKAVTKTLSQQFAEFTAEKAYKATQDDQEVFYVKLSKDGANSMILFDTEGKILAKKEIEEKKS